MAKYLQTLRENEIGCLAVVGIIVLFLLIVVGAFLLNGLIVMLLWNALVPSLLDGPTITFWTGLLIGAALWFVGAFFK